MYDREIKAIIAKHKGKMTRITYDKDCYTIYIDMVYNNIGYKMIIYKETASGFFYSQNGTPYDYRRDERVADILADVIEMIAGY